MLFWISLIRHGHFQKSGQEISMSESDYARGVADAKKAIAAKIRDMACYFDKWTCHSGKYASSNATESLNPDQIAEIITDAEVASE
jgi:hypothetical protein